MAILYGYSTKTEVVVNLEPIRNLYFKCTFVNAQSTERDNRIILFIFSASPAFYRVIGSMSGSVLIDSLGIIIISSVINTFPALSNLYVLIKTRESAQHLSSCYTSSP